MDKPIRPYIVRFYDEDSDMLKFHVETYSAEDAITQWRVNMGTWGSEVYLFSVEPCVPCSSGSACDEKLKQVLG